MFAGAAHSTFTYAGGPNDSKVWPLAPGEVHAAGKPLTWLTFWELVQAGAVASGKTINWKAVWLLAKAISHAAGKPIEFQATGSAPWQLAKLHLEARSGGIKWLIFWKLARAETEATGKPLTWLTFWELAKASVEAEGKSVEWDASGTASWELAKAIVEAAGKVVDLNYLPINRIPDLTVRRIGTGVEIDLLNSANAGLSIRRAEGNIGALDEIIIVPLSSLPWTDTDTEEEENYIYQGVFSIAGEKDGEPVVIESQPGSPRITIGNNRTI